MSGRKVQGDSVHHAKKPLYRPQDPAHPNERTTEQFKRKLTQKPRPVSLPKQTIAANEVNKHVKIVGGHEVHIPSFLQKRHLLSRNSKSLKKKISLKKQRSSLKKKKSVELIKDLKKQKIVTVKPIESDFVDLNQPSGIECVPKSSIDTPIRIDLNQPSSVTLNESKINSNKISQLDLSAVEINEERQIKIPVFKNFNATPVNVDIELSDEEKDEIKKQAEKRKRRSSLTPLDRETMRKERLSSDITSRQLNLQKYRESFSKRKQRDSTSLIENK